jgi:hypothetical protein
VRGRQRSAHVMLRQGCSRIVKMPLLPLSLRNKLHMPSQLAHVFCRMTYRRFQTRMLSGPSRRTSARQPLPSSPACLWTL